jgi:hypothetical protein
VFIFFLFNYSNIYKCLIFIETRIYFEYKQVIMSEVWQESGAITYVAITVVVFVFIAMCVVWFITKKPNPQYTSVGKTSNEDIVSSSQDTVDQNYPAFFILITHCVSVALGHYICCLC